MFFKRKTSVSNFNSVTKSFGNRRVLIIVIAALVICAGLFAYIKFFMSSERKNPKQEKLYVSENEKNKTNDNDENKLIIGSGEKKSGEDAKENDAKPENNNIKPENKDTKTENNGKKSEDSGEKSEASDEIIPDEIPSLPDKPGSEDVAEAIYKTAQVGMYKGALTLSYAQPQIPSEFHASVKLEIFDASGATEFRYISDAGWLSEPQNYDASEKQVLEKLGVNTLENKLMVLSVKVGDKNLESYATVYQLVQDYDGTRSFTSAQL